MLLALAAVAAWLFMKGNNAAASLPLPADPAGRRARARTAIASQDTKGIPAEWLYFQAQLETGDFKLTKADGTPSNYALTRSLFNRHVGSGRGEYSGRSHMTAGGEDLRIYKDPEQSVRDIIQLYADDGLYADAYAAALSGDRDAFYELVARGNGRQGFVGDPNAHKAVQYVADLKSTANRGVV